MIIAEEGSLSALDADGELAQIRLGDVAPVLERRCFSCHANGGIAADDHDFSSFATLHAQRHSVLAQVSMCAMPPSQATPLEPDEADVVLRWAACGAPQN